MARVLVIDDEPNIREMIQIAMEAAGHEVSLAADGEEGVRKLRRRPSDVVLLDLMMPGMSGLKVLERIREMPLRGATPVIVITGKHDPAVLQREVAYGVVDHIVKPFHLAELEGAIERAVSDHDDEREERRRILESDAQIYGSLRELATLARSES